MLLREWAVSSSQCFGSAWTGKARLAPKRGHYRIVSLTLRLWPLRSTAVDLRLDLKPPNVPLDRELHGGKNKKSGLLHGGKMDHRALLNGGPLLCCWAT
jgi:hypothetical protein